MAAPLSNTNALKTGQRCPPQRYGLALNELGKRYETAYRQVVLIRRSLESHRRGVLGLASGERLPISDAYLIDGICIQELVIRVARMQLAKDPDPATVAKLLGNISAAYSYRASLLGKLGIGGDGQPASDPWTAIYASQGASTPAVQSGDATPDPPAESPGAEGVGHDAADSKAEPVSDGASELP